MGLFNKNKRKGLGIGIADHGRNSPRHTEEQDQPEPERVERIDEEQGMRGTNRPSQAEGER